MGRFLVVRGLGALGVLLVLISLVFVLQSVVPGDPVRARVGANASSETVARERHALGLDRPLTAQYVTYVSDAVRGNLGQSIRTSRSVMGDVGQFLPATLELVLAAMGLAVVLGGVLGVVAATASRGSGVLKTLFLSGASAPTFLLGFGLIYVFYLQLGWLPASGQTGLNDPPGGPTRLLVVDGLLAGKPSASVDALQHLVLPAISLALLPAVAIGRVLRSSLIEVFEADYVRTARAKGLRKSRVVGVHALRNSLIPVVTYIGIDIGALMGGALVTEGIFNIPGIGGLTFQSTRAGETPVIIAVATLLTLVFLLASLLVDLLYAVLDPRIRYD